MDGVSGASAVASLVILGAKLAIQAQTFIGKIKNASDDVRHISSDLESIVGVLGRLEGALREPKRRNVFEAMNGSDDFLNVTSELMAVFKRFEVLMKRYEGVEESRVLKARWGWSGEREALVLGRRLAMHKSTLILTLQLTNVLALSSVGEGLTAGLAETRDNTQDILHQMQLLSGSRPAGDRAVLRWLEQAASYAESTIGNEDAEDMRRASLETPIPATPANTRSTSVPSEADDATGGNMATASSPPADDEAPQRLAAAGDAGGNGETATVETSNAAYRLGCLYINTQNWAKAEEPISRALTSYEKLYGPRHMSTIQASFNLGTLRRHQHRPMDAEKLYLEALKNMEALRRDTSHVVYNIALLYHEQERFLEAVAWYLRAVTELTRSYGADYQHTIAAHSAVASVYEKRGRTSEAEKHYKLALGG